MARKKSETAPTNLSTSPTESETLEAGPTQKETKPKAVRAPRKPKATPVAEPATETLDSLVSDLLGTSIAFRAAEPVTDAPVKTESAPRKRIGSSRKEPASPAPVAKETPKADDTTWDLGLPIPAFRSRSEDAPKPRAERPAQRERTPREARPPREQRARQDRPQQEDDFESQAPIEVDNEPRREVATLREFTPTFTLELEDEGRTLVVLMRAAEGVPPMREQSRTRGGRRGRPERAPEAVEETPTAPTTRTTRAPKIEKIVVPPRALIETPADAPQIVMRNGIPTLVRDGRVYPNFWFYATIRDKTAMQTVLDEVKQAETAGVDVVVIGFEAICDKHHFEQLAADCESTLEKIVATNRDAQVIFHLDLVAARGWELDFRDASYRGSNGDLAEPSLSSDGYWNHVEMLLRHLVAKLTISKFASNLLGIDLDRASWKIPTEQVADKSQSAEAKFAEWVRDRYHGDRVLLRASWFNGSVDFGSVKIPVIGPRRNGSPRLVRSERRERPVVDYSLFLSDQAVARISDLAYAIKEESRGRLVVGVRYGTSFEFDHPASGQLALGKVLRTPEIDFVSASPSFRDRQPGGTAVFPVPTGSFALNGKLFVSVEDFKTSLSNRMEPDTDNPVLRTPQALESVHYRGFGAALAQTTGVCWSDQWGSGWLSAASVWQRAKQLVDESTRGMAASATDPEVAIFIDERALAYVEDTEAFNKMTQDVREAVARAGVSYGLFLLSDLTHRERFPESKVNIFLNAWDIRPELRSAIKTRLQRDNKVLCWLYTCGLFDAGRESLETAREVTGIAIRPQPIFSPTGSTIRDRSHPLTRPFSSATISSGFDTEPSYFAIPEDGIVLGEYTQSGLPSFVSRDVKGEGKGLDWTSVFLGEPVINAELVRALVIHGRGHVWTFGDDVVHVRDPFLSVHCSTEGQRTVAMPGRWSAYNTQTKEWAVVDSTHLKFASPVGVTHNFLVGPTHTIKSLLEADNRSLLRMEDLPVRESNIRIDVSNFDVPIMKLDSISGASDDETSVDEWFVKFAQEDDYEEDAALMPGAYRGSGSGSEQDSDRSRGRRRRGDRPERKTLAQKVDFKSTGGERLKDTTANMELDILFRKRD